MHTLVDRHGGSTAAENHAMQTRATKIIRLTTIILFGWIAQLAGTANGQMLSVPGIGNTSSYVSEATYLVPSGQHPMMQHPMMQQQMIAQAMYQPPGAMMHPGMMMQHPGMMQSPMMMQNPIQQVGYFGCDSSACDAYGCDGCGQCPSGPGGILGAICSGDTRSITSPANGPVGQCLSALAPYTDAGLCAQRWFDVQAELMFLSRTGSSPNQAVTSQGIGGANIVLNTDDVTSSGLTPGYRLTANMLFGAGANLEAIYFGSHHFSESSTVTGTFNLFSAFSNFGTVPPNGFQDTDGSSRQSVGLTSDIHSGEANYRRRWVGPYCRFQGSWLLGFRYFDVDEQFTYSAYDAPNQAGAIANPGFFISTTDTRNGLVGAQLGGDIWWNIYPGINLGIELKGGLFGNHAEHGTMIQSNSINLLAGNPTAIHEFQQDGKTATLAEIQARLVYRFSYSWSFSAAYWFLGVDGLALGAANLNTNNANLLFANPAQTRPTSIALGDSLTMQGFTVGLEYLW